MDVPCSHVAASKDRLGIVSSSESGASESAITSLSKTDKKFSDDWSGPMLRRSRANKCSEILVAQFYGRKGADRARARERAESGQRRGQESGQRFLLFLFKTTAAREERTRFYSLKPFILMLKSKTDVQYTVPVKNCFSQTVLQLC